MKHHIANIKLLLEKGGYQSVTDIRQLPSSGSNRIYYRVSYGLGQPSTILAAFNPDLSENIAWYSYSVHFRNTGLAVPEVYAKDDSYTYFLLQDLGDVNLLSLLETKGESEVLDLYKKALTDLVKFQVDGIKGLDLDVAYPVKDFDRRSIMWDLNYFKYYFIKTHNLEFNETQLEDDFERFATELLKAESSYFLYRDFQARNIMFDKGKLWYIDFQGGRKGPLQYDVVSLLYQAKAALSNENRKILLTHYLENLDHVLPGSGTTFKKHLPAFIYFRLMQVLGAYGFRGLIQKKGHFLQSIPYAISNLKSLLENTPLDVKMPALASIFKQIADLKQYSLPAVEPEKLTVSIKSFSFKKGGYPVDFSENGGGFVFDCRALPNPGRIPELRNYTGRDSQIIDFLQPKKEVQDFVNQSVILVRQNIDNYLERGFKHLEVNYGCTGGMHRSVYSAEQLRANLASYGDKINIELKHLVIDG